MRAATRLSVLGLVALALAAPQAGAGQALAVEMGCYNCHGQPLRADAPSLDGLAAKFARRRGDSAAEQHVVDELRHGDIAAHQRLSPETARALVRWLFEGAH